MPPAPFFIGSGGNTCIPPAFAGARSNPSPARGEREGPMREHGEGEGAVRGERLAAKAGRKSTPAFRLHFQGECPPRLDNPLDAALKAKATTLCRGHRPLARR